MSLKLNQAIKAIAASLVALVLVTACGGSGGSNTPTPATVVSQCDALMPAGLTEWITQVESVIDAMSPTPGTSSDERSASYHLWKLHEDFKPYHLALIAKAADIRNLGPGCMSRYDSIIQVDRGLPIVGARVFLCSLRGISFDPITGLFSCPSEDQVSQDVQTLIRAPLAASRMTFDGPTLEFLQGLQPWSATESTDIYESFASFSKAWACNSYTNLSQADPAQFSRWLEIFAWSNSYGALPLDVLTGKTMLATDGALPELTMKWVTSPTENADAAIQKDANDIWVGISAAEQKSLRGASLAQLVPLQLDVICAGVIQKVDVLTGTPPTVGNGSTQYGLLDGLYDGLTKCSTGVFGKENECKMTRIFMAYPKILDAYSEVVTELGKLSSFSLSTE
jgi:hypothetical protein